MAETNDTDALALIKEELERLDPDLLEDDDTDGYCTGVLLLAALWVTGTDIEKLTQFTGYRRDFVVTVSSRMHMSGLWDESGVMHSDHWYHGGSYNTAIFWADVLVGVGLLMAEPLENSDFRYRTVGDEYQLPYKVI